MVSEDYTLTPTGKIKRPEIQQLGAWIKYAWVGIPEDPVIKSFKKCGISDISGWL
jgi:hypothetical protein